MSFINLLLQDFKLILRISSYNKNKRLTKNLDEVSLLLKKILRGLFTIIGISFGYIIPKLLISSHLINFISSKIEVFIFQFFCMLILGLILYLISPRLNLIIIHTMNYIEKNIQKLPANELLFGTAGAIIGLIISTLFVNLIAGIPIVGPLIAVVIAAIMAALGANIATKKREEILELFSNINFKKGSEFKNRKKASSKGVVKILDTSVIIDGRILDICKTKFIEGTLIIPTFVLSELRHIADSSDSLKRSKGRRGLDVLNKIQKDSIIDVEISEQDFPGIKEVDNKLLKLAEDLNGKIITTDYNLNKVAQFQGIDVLNINELVNAVKPIALAGEEMRIKVIKDGKELNQGVAYLDDGTMVVVSDGKHHSGEYLDVIVTSVLKTANGRMMFAKRKEVA